MFRNHYVLPVGQKPCRIISKIHDIIKIQAYYDTIHYNWFTGCPGNTLTAFTSVLWYRYTHWNVPLFVTVITQAIMLEIYWNFGRKISIRTRVIEVWSLVMLKVAPFNDKEISMKTESHEKQLKCNQRVTLLFPPSKFQKGLTPNFLI